MNELVYHSSGDFRASQICKQSQSRAGVTGHPPLPYRVARGPLLSTSTTFDVTRKSNTFSFSSGDGVKLVREVLRDVWSHTPRDYQIEAVGKLLDGIDVLAILPTGAGKTAILMMFMLVLDHMRLNPGCLPSRCRQFPDEPIVVVVYPTNCLEEEQAAVFREAGITAVVINAETPERSDMWTRAGENGPRVLLLSPEQLISKRLEKLVNDSAFRRRVCLLAVDEAHLLDSWGNSFRKSYQQIEYVRARFESSLVAIAMTATLLPGDQAERVCNFVGLRGYHTVQRSNRRSEIQLIFRVLSHGIENWEFSDLRWIIDDMQRKKIIIFCTSIRDGFRIFSYLWRLLDSPPDVRGDQLRMYNALNWPDYNLRTRELIRKQDGCRVIVATDILMVGVDFPDIDDVVIVGHPPHPNDYIQKIGRAGRDRALVSNPRGITYITSYALAAAREQLGVAKQPKRKKPTTKEPTAKKHKASAKKNVSKSSKSLVSKPMAELIVSDCKTSSLDKLYNNPPLGELPRCNCSGCAPEPETSKRRTKREAHGLPKEMKDYAMKKLVTLRKKIFIEEVQSAVTDPFFVLPRVLPDELITSVVDALPQLSFDALKALVNDGEIAKTHMMKIWTIATELRITCEQQLKQKADKKAAKKAERSAQTKRKREPTDVSSRDTSPSDFQEEGVQPKRRKIQPTKRLPPPAAQHFSKTHGDRTPRQGLTTGDPASCTPGATSPVLTTPTSPQGSKRLPLTVRHKQVETPVVPIRRQQGRRCKGGS